MFSVRLMFAFCMCVAVNLIAYAAYVTGCLYAETLTLTFQFLLSAFNLLWTTIAVPEIIMYGLSTDSGNSKWLLTALQIIVQCICAIINPLVVVIGLDSSCFRSVLIPPGDINYFYFVTECIIYNTAHGKCILSIPVKVTSKLPPVFYYTNQCYSSAIVYNTPPVLITSAFTIIALASWTVIGNCNIPQSKVPKLFQKLIPSILWPKLITDFPASTIAASLVRCFAVMITFGVASPSLIGNQAV
jgi:hypothetical protein